MHNIAESNSRNTGKNKQTKIILWCGSEENKETKKGLKMEKKKFY